MKVLFAVNNDEISKAIKKKYQEKYKDILSYKNVYYFNAIVKELQKDKTYDRIVISEDLEPFANNNYDTIDKFLFDRLDSISDEATDESGNDTQIILICADRRNLADDIFVKFFGIGIYSAIIGQDRSIDEVCKLIHKPRAKKEAKQYYKIDVDKVDYQSENENDVNETEIQNILAHYKRLGKNEDKYVESFNNIVSQYNDIQLKIIIRCLPLNVQAVLEERSPKYQELTAFTKSNSARTQPSTSKTLNNYKGKEEPVKVKMLKEQTSKTVSASKPIVIPANVSKKNVKKLISEEMTKDDILEELDDIVVNQDEEQEEKILNNNIIMPEKKKRGRPTKTKVIEETEPVEKKKRGRPKKDIVQEESSNVKLKDDEKEINLFDLNENTENEKIDSFDLNGDIEDKENDLFDVENNEKDSIDLFSLDEAEESSDEDESADIFNLGNSEDLNDNQEEDLFSSNEDDNGINLFDMENEDTDINYSYQEQTKNPLINDNENKYDTYKSQIVDTSNDIRKKEEFVRLLTKEKKVVCFVGTTKNGTSFLVNNVGEMLSSMGIATAILDMTKTKNAYYIYTNNNEGLRKTAAESIAGLKEGTANGVKVNRSLTIFTNLPGEDRDYSDATSILSTLVKNYSVVLIDCDFNTPVEYFDKAQEIYLVQSMDVLTIQPLTAFLRDLKVQKILKPEKLKVIINKEQKVKNLSLKTLIGGIAFYNDPTMSYMTELFDKDKIPYCTIPFEMQNYSKYLNSLVECSVTLNGYTKGFMQALKELASMIYPLLSKPTYSPRGEKYKDAFSNETNDTLNRMKRKYQ